MLNAATRVFVGLWMLLAVAVLAAPGFSSAARAAPASAGVDHLVGLADLTVPTSILPTTSTVPFTVPLSLPFTLPTSFATSTSSTTVVRTTTTRPHPLVTTTITTVAPTTTTSTTVAPLPAPAPPPVTLPLASAQESGNISAFFPILGGLGLFALIALLSAQWFLTKPGHRGPTL